MTERKFPYPIFLDLTGRGALVVGGGRVALRRARSLADAGARVRVVAPALLPEFRADGRFDCAAEAYSRRCLEGACIVVAATDNPEVNAQVAADARDARVLVNVVDRPDLCDFIVPARLRRGLLEIAISTGGAAPALAKRLAERLRDQFGPEYEMLLEVLREVREDLKRRNLAAEMRRRVFERLTQDDVLAAAREGRDVLREVVGKVVADCLDGE